VHLQDNEVDHGRGSSNTTPNTMFVGPQLPRDPSSQGTQPVRQMAEMKHLSLKKIAKVLWKILQCVSISTKSFARKELKFGTKFFWFGISVLQFYLVIASVKIAKQL